MDEPAKKDEKNLIIDWLTKLKEANQRVESIIQPLQENKELVREAVLPLVSAGAQASEFLSSLYAGVQPKRAELWDFATGSRLLQPFIPPEYLKSESVVNYQAFIAREVAPLVEEGKQVAKSLEEELEPDDAAREMQDFHESLAAAQFVSASLEETAREVGKKEKNRLGQEKNIFGRIATWLSSIEENITRIKDKIHHALIGGVGTMAGETLAALGKFKDLVKSGAGTIADAFRGLCSLVERLLLGVLNGLFDFIRHIQSIAKKKGFPLSDVTLELEGAGVDVAIVAGIPFPIPKFKPPKITMKFGVP